MGNNREFDRIVKSIKCEVHSDTMTFSSTLNISEGGIFISSPEPLKEGVTVSLYLYVNEEESIMVSGVVKWNREDDGEGKAGMGIEFLEINENDKDFIKQFIK